MKCTRLSAGILTTLFVASAGVIAPSALGNPAFTYQGQLKQDGEPCTGLRMMRFSLYDDPNSGTQLGSPYTPVEGVQVTDGLFTVVVDASMFGVDAFNGDPRWLEIEIHDGIGWVALSPRQPMTPAPYALYAFDSSGGGDSLWSANGSDIYYLDGYVGVGEEYPWAPLTVVGYGGDDTVAVENYGDGTSATIGGTGVGVAGRSYNPDAPGLYGVNYSYDTGLCIGVWGRASNPDGYAGYFDGRGYFSGDVGIGRIPTTKLDVAGTLKADGFQLTDTPVAGYVLTCDDQGNGAWLPGGSGSSLWTIDASGINYQSGNVGIGAASEANTGLVVDDAGTQAIRVHNGNLVSQTFAIFAEADADMARTIFGDATSASGATVGVFGRVMSPDGYGVVGDSMATSGVTTGVWGRANSPAGCGVWGSNDSTSGSPRPVGVCGTASHSSGVGVKGDVSGSTGIAVWGQATATSGPCTGVRGESSSTAGRGMYGYATSSSGQAVGVLGETGSQDGFGVWGHNDDDGGSGDAIGVYGSTNSTSGAGVKGHAYAPDGYGVYGINEGGSGNAIGGYFKTNSNDGYGVYGESMSASSGYAGYFVGRGYFSNNVGIGTALPGSLLTVAGLVESTTGGFKFPDGTIQTTAGGGGGDYWQPYGSEIYYDAGNVGIGVSDPFSTLHVAGGNWDVASTEGDFRIGSPTYRLKMGVGTTGGEAGECRIFAGGPSSELILGANGQDCLTVTSAKVDIVGPIEVDGFQLTDSPTAGYVLTCDEFGNATWQAGGGGLDLPYEGTIAIEEPAFKIINTDTSDETLSRAGHFECAGRFGAAVYAKATGSQSTGVYADVSGSEATAVTAKATNGRGLEAHGRYAAGQFYGNVVIFEYGTIDKVVELGKGLDYAEGFDVTDSSKVEPGTVLVLDSRHAGQLITSTQAYDRKVAGIVAGAKGLGSGVRLGGEFDHDVALAGRVYCNVIATNEPVEIGDLLTTSDVPGCAMKVQDHQRAQGAILGKAMESLAAGERGQILVLVTLQ